MTIITHCKLFRLILSHFVLHEALHFSIADNLSTFFGIWISNMLVGINWEITVWSKKNIFCFILLYLFVLKSTFFNFKYLIDWLIDIMQLGSWWTSVQTLDANFTKVGKYKNKNENKCHVWCAKVPLILVTLTIFFHKEFSVNPQATLKRNHNWK